MTALAAGISTRAIAPIVGKSHEIVARDIRARVNNVDTSEPEQSSHPGPLSGYLTDEPGQVIKLTGSGKVIWLLLKYERKYSLERARTFFMSVHRKIVFPEVRKRPYPLQFLDSCNGCLLSACDGKFLLTLNN